MIPLRILRRLGIAAFLAGLSVPTAQASDPLTRFLDGLLKGDAAPQAAPTASPPALDAPMPPAAARPVLPPAPRTAQPAAARPAAPPKPVAAKPAPTAPQGSAQPAPPAVAAAAPPPVQTAEAAAAPAQRIPASPEAALDRINRYFNGLDQLTATFVQNSSNGQRTDGSLALKRPGQLRFAYSPPSTLEIVSDGRSVAIRDKKLGTNDVYSIGQTPLKFLLKEQFNLARDVKVQDVQVSPAGLVTVRFEDSATIGGTSKVTLRFDARANELKQWTVVDPQGYETTVVLSDVSVIQRPGVN